MKKFILFSILSGIIVCSTYSQNKLLKPHELIEQAQNQKQVITTFSLGKVLPTSKSTFISLSNHTLFEYNDDLNKQLTNEEFIRIQLPSSSSKREVKNLLLVRVDIFTEDFKVNTSSDHSEDIERGIHYRGIVEGDPNSIAAISIFEGEVMGIYSTSHSGNTVIGKLKGSKTEHLIYNEKDFDYRPGFNCMTDDDVISKLPKKPSTQMSDSLTKKCVRLYYETEYDMYQRKGSVQAVVNYTTGIHNQVAVLYNNDGIAVSLSEVYVWNTTDPYTESSIFGTLREFQKHRTRYNGDLGQLLTFRQIGGGVAATINGICDKDIKNTLCISAIQPIYENVPTYSWTVMVVAHEFGHLFGSRHTHACVWNGNNTAIDGCARYTEGNCYLPGNPSGGGTIMSYCNMVNVGINFTKGFGPQPSAKIRSVVNSGSCLGNDCSGGGGEQCTNSVSNFPYMESFEASLGNLSNVKGDDIDWIRYTGSTPSWRTGPTIASDTSYYIYVEASGGNHPDKVALLDGCFNFSNLRQPKLSFDYHMYGSSMGSLDIEISTNDGKTFTNVFSKSGNQGNKWHKASVDLEYYLRKHVIIRLRAKTGKSWKSDIAIDKFTIEEGNKKPIIVFIKNKKSGKNMSVEGCVNTYGANIEQYSKTNKCALWELIYEGDYDYRIKNVGSGLSLDIKGSSQYDDAPLIQWPYKGSKNQKFKFYHIGSDGRGNDVFLIKNSSSNKCLDVKGGKYENGVNIIQYYCNKADNQAWTLHYYSIPGNQINDIELLESLSINQLSEIEKIKPSNEVIVWPNPNGVGVLNIESEGIKASTITVYSITGRAVLRTKFTDKLNISTLRKGIYFVKIDGANVNTVKRLIIK